MGRKGMTKQKPTKSRPFSSADISGSSNNERSSQRSSVQSLIKDKGAPFTKDGMNPFVGSNKTQEKP
jgi:hypothetical protein